MCPSRGFVLDFIPDRDVDTVLAVVVERGQRLRDGEDEDHQQQPAQAAVKLHEEMRSPGLGNITRCFIIN